MLDYSLVHWISFVTTAGVIVATPGPDLACILGQTVRHGRRAGSSALAGMCAGATFYVVFVTLGLGALISSSPFMLTALKWIGAAYLVYLGVHAWLPSKISDKTTIENSGTNKQFPPRAIRQSVKSQSSFVLSRFPAPIRRGRGWRGGTSDRISWMSGYSTCSVDLCSCDCIDRSHRKTWESKLDLRNHTRALDGAHFSWFRHEGRNIKLVTRNQICHH